MGKREGTLCKSYIVLDSYGKLWNKMPLGIPACGTPVWHTCLSGTCLPECAVPPGLLHTWSLILVKLYEVDTIIMPILQMRNSICPRIHSFSMKLTAYWPPQRRKEDLGTVTQETWVLVLKVPLPTWWPQVTPLLFHPLQIKGSYSLVALLLS